MKKTSKKKISSKPKQLRVNTIMEPEREIEMLASIGSDVKWLKKYPPPIETTIFVEKWAQFIPDVASRENFKPGHLGQLKILCSLYEEYELLMALVEVEGYSYYSEGGRNGPQKRITPEVAQLNRTRTEIRNYSKTLGLLLVKDTDFSGKGKEDEGEWE